MNIRRIFILLRKEIAVGSKSFLFIFALVMPLAASLIISLIFGTLFREKARLGITDLGASEFVTLAAEIDSIDLRAYESEAELRTAVAEGRIDLGIVLPAGFDAAVKVGQTAEITAYIWGQSLLSSRAVLGTTTAVLLRQMVGQESPVNIIETVLGDTQAVPWNVRLIPFLVIMSIVIGGVMIPASALVEEKMKRTLRAVTITPATTAEMYLAKGVVGTLLALFAGVMILVINRAWGDQPGLLLLLLTLAGTMAAAFGILLGIATKDINTLFATIKGIGIFLYAPAFIYFFPDPPAWAEIAVRFFPTYYMLGPIIDVTMNGKLWADIAVDVGVLVVLILLLFGLIGSLSRRTAMAPA